MMLATRPLLLCSASIFGSAQRINAYPDPVEARKMFVARQPMGRLAKPEEIAPMVVFLASDEATFVTGNIYSCDGGMTI